MCSVHVQLLGTMMTPPRVSAEAHAEALEFEAPFLIEKLVKDQVVESPDEARALFREVKRYLVLTAADRTVAWAMYSLRVDHIWHQFILFTREYIDYCREHFDRYIQHAPSTAPVHEVTPRLTPSTFRMFADKYEELFGEPLPDVWYDEKNVTLKSRIITARAGTLSLGGGDDMVELLDGSGELIFAVEPVARPALEFIARTGTFFVRELPRLADEQKIALVSTLVEHKLLDLAS
jgi:hypothetical protein